MRNVLFSVAAAVGIALASAAAGHAADMPMKAPPMPAAPAYGWTGFYLGGNVGGGWSSDPTVTFTPNDPLSAATTSTPISFNMSRPVGGFQAGYNWQINQTWLVGVESDFDFSAIAGSGQSNFFNPGTTNIQQTVDEKVKWFGTVRGRLGYLATNGLLLYGTGGFAYGKVADSAQASNLGPASAVLAPFGACVVNSQCYSGASASVLTGWTAGGGLELALANHWTVKAEYLYVSLGSSSFNEPNLGAIGVPTPTGSITAHYSDTNFHIARAGVNYKF
jgi:outer membrane immunogenic protein